MRLLPSLLLLAGCAASGAAPQPPSEAGPACTIDLPGGPVAACLGAGIVRRGGGLIVNFNFCWRGDTYVWAPPGTRAVTIDGILLLPAAEWHEGVYSEATGFLDVQLRDGPHYRQELVGPRAMPIDLRVALEPVTGGGSALRGHLQLALPRVDRPGEPLVFHATID